LGAGKDESLHLQANEQVTIRLLQTVAPLTRRVIYASSQVVYGDARHLAVTEDFPLVPDGSPYACSKVNSENWLRWFHGKYGGQYLALRFCGFIEGGGLIDYLIRQMLVGEQVELHSHGIVKRDYLPADDAIDVLVSALDYRGTGYLPINIGSGQAVSAHELANLISTELASCSRISLSEKTAVQGDFVFCIDRARKMLNFSPSSLTSAVRDYARRRWEGYKLSNNGVTQADGKVISG
jgi:nucleoside-diphosphate-sugar epimerase